MIPTNEFLREAFDRQWADVVGTRHAVGVGNGMDAIEMSARLFGTIKGWVGVFEKTRQ